MRIEYKQDNVKRHLRYADQKTEPSVMRGLPVEKLTAEHEKLLVDAGNFEVLIMGWMREAILYAGRCCRGALGPGELMSICYEALSKSAPRFKPGGISFLAYSKPDLRGQIFRYWKQQNTVKNAYLHESEDEPVINRMNRTQGCREEEYDAAEWDDESVEPNFVEPEFDLITLREKWEMVKPLLNTCLNERERTVLQLNYESGFSFEQIAKMMVPKVCREAIRMTHERALRKLRNSLLCSKRLYGTL